MDDPTEAIVRLGNLLVDADVSEGHLLDEASLATAYEIIATLRATCGENDRYKIAKLMSLSYQLKVLAGKMPPLHGGIDQHVQFAYDNYRLLVTGDGFVPRDG